MRNEPLFREATKVQTFDIIIGTLMVLGGIYMLLDRQRTAHWLYEYYQRRPQRNLRPKWLFHVFRPSERVTLMLVTAFVFFMVAAGVYTVLAGVL